MTTFVGEAIIDRVAAEIAATEEGLVQHIEAFSEDQPFLASYFFSEAFAPFTPPEREYALFLGLVIWTSVKHEIENLQEVDEDGFIAAEEANLEKIQNVTAKKFRDRLDVFFKDTDQEDLLAFIEDSLVEDEDTTITKEGRELLFIILKTMVDCLTRVR